MPGDAQARDEGRGLPVAGGNADPEPFAFARPPVLTRHVGRGPGLIDEDEPRGIEVASPGEPRRTPHQDVRAILLGGVRRLFFSAIRRRSKKGHSVATPTPTPREASLDLSSTSVMSGVPSTSRRIQRRMRLDAARAAVPAQSLGSRVALNADTRPPADRARRAHPEPRRRLSARHPASKSPQEPVPSNQATAPSICPPASDPGRQLESASSRFENPNPIHSARKPL